MVFIVMIWYVCIYKEGLWSEIVCINVMVVLENCIINMRCIIYVYKYGKWLYLFGIYFFVWLDM